MSQSVTSPSDVDSFKCDIIGSAGKHNVAHRDNRRSLERALIDACNAGFIMAVYDKTGGN